MTVYLKIFQYNNIVKDEDCVTQKWLVAVEVTQVNFTSNPGVTILERGLPNHHPRSDPVKEKNR